MAYLGPHCEVGERQRQRQGDPGSGFIGDQGVGT